MGTHTQHTASALLKLKQKSSPNNNNNGNNNFGSPNEQQQQQQQQQTNEKKIVPLTYVGVALDIAARRALPVRTKAKNGVNDMLHPP